MTLSIALSNQLIYTKSRQLIFRLINKNINGLSNVIVIYDFLLILVYHIQILIY